MSWLFSSLETLYVHAFKWAKFLLDYLEINTPNSIPSLTYQRQCWSELSARGSKAFEGQTIMFVCMNVKEKSGSHTCL